MIRLKKRFMPVVASGVLAIIAAVAAVMFTARSARAVDYYFLDCLSGTCGSPGNPGCYWDVEPVGGGLIFLQLVESVATGELVSINYSCSGLDCGYGGPTLVCAGTGAGAPAEKPGPSPFMQPANTTSGEYGIPGPNGAMACGVGLVGPNWGHRVFKLEDYPNCASYLPDVTVLCLSGDGVWSAANVSDVVVSEANGTVAFQVKQHGSCGIFPN